MWEYRRWFELLASPLSEVSEKVMESTFINGLKPEVRVEVRLANLSGLTQIMEYTQRAEDRSSMIRLNRSAPMGPWGRMSSGALCEPNLAAPFNPKGPSAWATPSR